MQFLLDNAISDPNDGNFLYNREFRYDNLTIADAIFSIDGNLLAVAVIGYGIYIHDTHNWTIIISFQTEIDENTFIEFSPKNNLFAVAYKSYTHIFKTADGMRLQNLTRNSYRMGDFAFSPDGKYLVTGAYNSPICLWHTSNWTGVSINLPTGYVGFRDG